MAGKKYISFDLSNEDDEKVVKALSRIDMVLGKSPKDIVTEGVETITASQEYKTALKKILEEDIE